MPIQKPTLSTTEINRNQKIITALIFQLKRAKEIQEPIHLGPFETHKEGKYIRYDYDTLIKELGRLNPKVAPDPFLLALAYAAIGQKTVSESATSSQFFKAKEQSVDSLLSRMTMLPNPVLLMLLRSITYDLVGERPKFSFPAGSRFQNTGFYFAPYTPVYYRGVDPFMRASYQGLELEYGIKKTRVKCYETMPEGMWPIEGLLIWEDSPKDISPLKKGEFFFDWKDKLSKRPGTFNMDCLSNYTKLINTEVEWDNNWLLHLEAGHRDASGVKLAYQYIAKEHDTIRYTNKRTPPDPIDTNWSPLNFSESLLSTLPYATDLLYRSIVNNERWYEQKNYQYAYYFRYLFNAYKAYDAYEKTYQDIRNRQSVFSRRLPIEPLQAIKAVKKHLFNKLMILAQIKLAKGWDEVVNKGMRVDLKAIFGELFEGLQKGPTFSCMQKLFQSKAWTFLQGKIANSIIYYQKHPDLINEDDFDALSEFANHLLKHHSDLIKKDVKQQLIVLGIVLSIAAAGLSIAAAPSGPIAHIAAGSAEAAVITEFILGFVHLSHGLHEAFDKIKDLKLTGTPLPLSELHQDTQEACESNIIKNGLDEASGMQYLKLT
jgi:ribosomal protein L20A (L18A)